MAICYPDRSGIAPLFDLSDLATLLEFPLDLFVLIAVVLGAVWGVLKWKPWSKRPRVAITPEAPSPTAVGATAPGTVSASATVAATPGPARGAVPSHIMAVIAASVHSCMHGRAHRVASVVEVKEALDWAREGRRHIFASHKIR